MGAIGIALLIAVAAFSYFTDTKELYGNDEDSIIKVIHSIENYKNGEISILEINDFKDVRIVGFLSDNSPSYIQFHKSQEGNYIWKNIESAGNESISMFLPLMEISKMMFIMNTDNKIAKIKVDINGSNLEQNIIPNKAAVIWLDLPQSINGSYEFRNYQFYDQHGELIR